MLPIFKKFLPRVALFIVNYNMPERTDKLVEYLHKNVKCRFDLYVIDNGSDICLPSKYTNVFIKNNVQTCNGWLMGLSEADKSGKDYYAYGFIITSASFISQSVDPITPLLEKLVNDSNAIGVHPSLNKNSTTAWTHLKCRGTNALRRTWMIDNILSLYRADWFNSIGRFDKNLIYAWGIDLETCYLARKQSRSIWIDDRIQVEKITDIGYSMNRMNMNADERRKLAKENMDEVLSKRYGLDYFNKMTSDYIDPEWR